MKYRYRSEEELKDSGVEWIGCIPKNWEVKKIKHLFELKKNKSDDENPTVLSLTQKGLKIRDVSNNEGQLASTYVGYTKIEKNDFILNPMDLISGYTDKAEIDGVISPAYTTFRNKSNIEINHDFYKRYFQMHYHHNFLFPWGEGVSFEHRWTLKNETFLNLPVITSSMIEQEKIANFLDEKTSQFDLIISKKEDLIKRLEEAKKSLISEVVTGKVKVIKSDDGYELVKRNSEEMKDSEVEWLGDIPKGWEVKKFKYLLSKIGSGKTPKGGSEVYQDEGVIFIRSQNVHNTGLRLDDVVYISHEADKEMKNSRIQKNDVLLNITGASIGRTSIFKNNGLEANVNQHVCILRPIVRYILPTLLNKIIQSDYIQEQIQSMQTGSSREGLNFEQIGNMNLVIDKDIKIQKIIDKCLDEKVNDMNNIIRKTKLQIEKLKEAKQSLISEAVTGKIEILD